MVHIPARTIGRRRSVSFKVAQIDVVSADVDLLIVGMFELDGANTLSGGANQLDLALHGTLKRLREGGIFKALPGETLMLSTPPPPIEARALMLIGMGGDPAVGFNASHSTELAMRAALRLDIRSVGCMLAWLGRDVPPERVDASAAAMMEGALRAIEGDVGRPRALEWIFDIRNGDAARAIAALRRVLGTTS